ncbi:DUF6491 family protein [Sphingosinicella sp. CPCC 101087]|uniref:DUF6491 family protein n=1 Tax=Sphingosinicella sp. CPCC 101087 TaxID=2497754 RepID=UPI00101C1FC8|nr:DUF6491 family protein [Sphingosinicella sp. CPCC 101087]
MQSILHRRAPIAFALLAGLGTLAACTDAGSPASASAQGEGRQCFRAEQVNGFAPLDDETVHVNVGANDVYRLDLFGPCPDVDWSLRIGIRSRGGSNWVCTGSDAELIVPSAIGPNRCQISSIRKLTDEEIRAHRESRRN